MALTNPEIAELLHSIAAVYQIFKENRFKIIAYERAADSIEHLTSEVKDYWDSGKLGEIPGVGSAIAEHLDELFKTGKSKYFAKILAQVPEAVFPLLQVPGLGPQKAYKLVTNLKLRGAKTIFTDLTKAIKAHKVADLETFGEKSEQAILESLEIYQASQSKPQRMNLPEADEIAESVINHLSQLTVCKQIDKLGSLRRGVSTIGDIDLAVATEQPEQVIKHFFKYPHQKLIEQGPTGASLIVASGRQVDLRVQKPQAYGAMLQYFTGSKNHNIKLREYALSKGLSLSEHGIKENSKLKEYASEEDFYQALGLAWVPPELREDQGEIGASAKGNLPQLVETKNIKGDLHVHTNYDLEPSHDLGVNSLEECLNQAVELNYEYLGISDHNPSISNHTEKQIIEIMKRRQEYYQQHANKPGLPAGRQVQLFIMLEVDILTNGSLALPDKAFDYVDAVIVSLHSSFRQKREVITKRILRALTSHHKVKILGHPTARKLGEREGVDADWSAVFQTCRERQIALEINSSPARLDLPDSLVFASRKEGLKFCIDTDAHAAEHMGLINYGVTVARRGWCEKHDIVNALSYNEFRLWLVNH